MFPFRLRQYLVAQQWRWQNRGEFALLPYLCRSDRATIDIGANRGMYTYWCLRYSRSVIAVEPSSAFCARLRHAFPKNVVVHQCVLSDQTGTALLRVPMVEGNWEFGRSTLEIGNRLDGYPTTEVVVEKLALDDLRLTDVGFVKIDVEGHELSVLRGGRNLLEGQRPRLLIECEERHRPNAVESICEFLRERGYLGYFADHSEIKSIESFDKPVMQNPNCLAGLHDQKRIPSTYVNNFMFIHRSDLAGVRLISSVLANRHARRPPS
jgi:FkbM family methyltransferase